MNKGYIGSGNSSSGGMVDFWEYDPATNLWKQQTNIPGYPPGPGTGFSILGKGYLGLGDQSAIWEFSPPALGPVIESAINTWNPYSIDDQIWKKEAQRVFLTGNEIVSLGPTDIQGTGGRIGVHPTDRPLYVTGNMGSDNNGVEFRNTNSTQGIGIGYNTIYAAGTSSSQSLGLKAKGPSGNLSFSTNGVERMRISGSGITQINPEPVATPTPSAPFSNYGFEYQTLRYFKDATSVVHLSGLLSFTGFPFDQLLFTLPALYRPSARLIFIVDSYGTRVDVLSNGEVRVSVGNDASWFSVSTVSFRADQ